MDAWDDCLASLPAKNRAEAAQWFDSRPPAIQALIRRYPPRTRAKINGKLCYLVSYMETATDPGFMFSEIDPAVDYDGALASKFFVCGNHLDNSSVVPIW